MLSELRGWLWPHIGWQRAAHYFWMRLKRMSGSPHSIAAGFASGAAASATPFVGFHFVTAFAFAFFTRGNYLAAAIGTGVGNPWTFPFIWAWTYNFGNWLLGRDESTGPVWSNLSWGQLFDNLNALIWPMLAGGMPTALLFWLVFYFPLCRLVAIYQDARRRRHRAKRRMTAQSSDAAAPMAKRDHGTKADLPS